MSTFIVREYEKLPDGRVLISLQKLLAKFNHEKVLFWAFRSVTLSCNFPLGCTVEEFERQSRELKKGVILGNVDFQGVLNSDFQMIDGFIDGYSNENSSIPLFTIECVDTSQWEITTDSNALELELKRHGFLLKNQLATPPSKTPTPRRWSHWNYRGRFLGDFHGSKEIELRNALIKLFDNFPGVKAAYLAEIEHDHGYAARVLCLKSAIGYDHNVELTEKIGDIFAALYAKPDFMDIIFLNPTQETELVKVCTPFFERPDAFQILNRPSATPFPSKKRP